jgi:hypothetical protein
VTTKTEAVKAYLMAFAPPDLAALYDEAMEVQVNVIPGEAEEAVEGEHNGVRWKGWQRDGQLWKEFRIPWGNFTFTDSQLGFDLSAHAEAIGMTGWDWQAKVSRWVGFDFDSLVGHQKGLSDEELAAVAERCTQVPWVTVRKSKSGKGLHLYVFLASPEATEDRVEHAALARAVLNLLSAATGLDLASSVDKLGCNLWVWHRDTRPGGLTLVKRGDELDEVPPNWKNHLPVVRGVRARADSPLGEEVDGLVGKQRLVGLDAEHRRLIAWFGQAKNAEWWWDGDRHMLVCHTSDLKLAHSELRLKGVFYTNAASAAGSGYQNCFAFPNRHGAWTVRRHGVGTQEHKAWTRDAAGWTRCSFNKPAELHAVASAHEGTESSKGLFHFSMARQALAALVDLGVLGTPELPPVMTLRPATLAEHDRGRLVLCVKREPSDPVLPGWLPSPNGKEWETLLNAQRTEGDLEPPDELVRHVVSAATDAGWFVHARGSWVQEPRQNVTALLIANGVSRKDLEPTLGTAIQSFWELINTPFGPEYPGNRRWNKFAARLAFVPREGPWPTWAAVFRHVGHSLTEALRELPWAKKHGVTNGLDYLLCWCASLIQEPLEPLPYLFLHGPQNSGKSIFHEALGLLFTTGYIRADSALTNAGRFNGELAGTVLCAIEETNLRSNKMAYDRIKDWVTAKSIQIHVKGRTPYDLPNSCHFVQCANPVDHCPILPGDTRITVCHVAALEAEVPKRELLPMLRAEAPAFLWHLRQLELPPASGRLRVPVVVTVDKTEQMAANQSELEVFLREQTYAVDGGVIPFARFREKFIEWLRPELRAFWSPRRIVSELPQEVVRGRYGAGGQIHLGNLSFEPELPPGRKFIKVNDALRQV